MAILIRLNLVGNNDELNIAILKENEASHDSNETETFANFNISLNKVSQFQTNDNYSSNQLPNSIQEPSLSVQNSNINLTPELTNTEQNSPASVIMGYYVVDKILGSRLNNQTNQHEFLLTMKNCNSTNENWSPPSDSHPLDFSDSDSVLYVRKSADLMPSRPQPTQDLPDKCMDESWNSVDIDETLIKCQIDEDQPEVVVEELNVNVDHSVMTLEKPNENIEQELVYPSDDRSKLNELKAFDMTSRPTSVSNYVCKKCGLAFIGKVTLRKHVMICQTEKFQCEYCTQLFSCENHLKKHLRIHIKSTKFRCAVCGFNYRSLTRLKNHEKQAHRSSYRRKYSRSLKTMQRFKKRNQFECQTCKRVFMRQKALQIHARSHEGGLLQFPCSQCKKFFISEETLKNHQESFCQFICVVCGIKFKEYSQLRDHENLHDGTNEISPSSSDASGFSKESNLFHCTLCKKSYKSEAGALLHRSLDHSDNNGKSVQCLICGVLLSKTSLRAHLRRHTGELLKCKFCDYKAIQQISIRAHEFAHHGGFMTSPMK